ncbi:hypothetical protein QVN76_07265 [Yersinia rochesterensis]|uniref:hypothetical protein n=1 Tax=Yersinia rochesterensis TaxID=1604335 RepID=UPI0025AB100B|nr:hypothetical protein [Yersinia rochesterensis]MDN0106690.1 hypothetical protein [Yersinia rochesterensis]
MSENTDYDKACREIARIAAALGIVDYSGDTSEIFDSIIIKDEKHQALAGENAAAIEAVRIFSNATEQLTEIIGDEIGMDGVSKLLHGFSIVGSMPTTTQALNEIKAQGAIEFSEFLKVQAKESLSRGDHYVFDRLNAQAVTAEKFAASLRAGSHQSSCFHDRG